MTHRTRRNRGGHNYKFTEKTHSVRGVLAIFLSILSLAACAGMIWVSYSSRGKAGIYAGSFGVLGLLVALLAFCISVSSIREQETFRIIPFTSLGFSLATVAAWVAIYIGGIG